MRQAFDGPASLLFSCLCWCVRQRGYGDGSTHYAWLSSIALLPWLPSFGISHHNLLPHIPRSVSPQSTVALALYCSTIPKLQLPAAASARGPASLSRVCMAVARTVWFSFHLGCHRSALLLWLRQLPRCVDQTLLNFPHPRRAGPVLLTLLFFPLVLEWVYIYMWGGGVYVFFYTGQVLLSALSWCFACASVSEGVFLMYPWREMYSASTYSFAILFSALTILVLMAFLYVIITQKSLLYQEKHLFKCKIYCKIYVSLKNKYTVECDFYCILELMQLWFFCIPHFLGTL